MVDVDAARTFVHGTGRLLDRRRLEHELDGGPPDVVLAALAGYRNADGGVGALEPDLRSPASQPIPVRYAFDVLAELPPSDEGRRLALGALGWLATVTEPDGGVPFVLPTDDGLPAAPWLAPAPGSSLLATAQLVAGAHRLGLEHPWLAGADAYCWARVDDVDPADAYTVLYVVDLLDVAPDRERAATALARLRDGVRAAMNPEGALPVPGGASGEVLDPLLLAPTPDHAGASLVDDDVLDRALDRLAGAQHDDGGWDVTWAAWHEAAHAEWRAAVTVDALRTLRAWGRR